MENIQQVFKNVGVAVLGRKSGRGNMGQQACAASMESVYLISTF